MSTRTARWRRQRVLVHFFLISSAVFTVLGLLILTLRSIDPSTDLPFENTTPQIVGKSEKFSNLIDTTLNNSEEAKVKKEVKNCATVEEMGEVFSKGFRDASLRARRIIENHFALNGASRIRGLPPDQFCRHGFVIGKASEAGLGNEMYKILTAAALSVMLNRSLIIGQTRGKYPFGDYITYSNTTFTLKEVKHLWRKNGCLTKYRRHLVMRIDDFQKPARTNILCSNWREWEQPIIWFQNTTDAVAAQFFLKNIHSEMRKTASDLFGLPENLEVRPNVFGELMKVLISPSENVERAVNWALSDGVEPDIALHMRMLMNRSVRAVQAALGCMRKAVQNLPSISKPKVVIVSDTPSTVKEIAQNLAKFAEVIRFDYKHYGNISRGMYKSKNLNFRVKDWGPAPRWVAFVDFFLASRARHAVISGANRRVGTTYAQLIAALAAATRLGISDDFNFGVYTKNNAKCRTQRYNPLIGEENSSNVSSIMFLSSFHSKLVSNGLRHQVGWGHVWNRFAGELSCQNQPNQCALTPLLPPAWWDGLWQSPLPRDIRRMEAYGIRLSGFGTFDDHRLTSYCTSRKNVVTTVQLI